MVHNDKIIAGDAIGGAIGAMHTDVSVENAHFESLGLKTEGAALIDNVGGVGGLVGVHSHLDTYSSSHIALLNVKNVSIYSHVNKFDDENIYSCGMVCIRSIGDLKQLSSEELKNIAVVSKTENSSIYGIADTNDSGGLNIYYDSFINTVSKSESRAFTPWKNTPQKTGTVAMCEKAAMNQSCNTSSYTTALDKADNNSGKWIQGTFKNTKYPQYKPF